jgi:hypothetical protein
VSCAFSAGDRQLNVLLRLVAISGIATTVPAYAISSVAPDVPAVITHPSPESRGALSRAVRVALNGASATLADDALTHDSVLVIEHAQPRDSQGRFLNGREIGRPELFRLVKRGARCVLIHERTGKAQVLKNTTCDRRPD